MIINISNDLKDNELIRLISSNANTSSQYVIFTNSQDDLFAINVAKVKELIMNKDIEITKNYDDNAITMGIARVRDSVVSMLCFDDWLGVKNYDKSSLKLIILANYSNRRIGIIVKGVVGIQSIDARELRTSSEQDDKTMYIFEIPYKGVNRICKVFDSDKMMMDAFPTMSTKEEGRVGEIIENIGIRRLDKLILFAEDSIIIQKSICKLFDRAGFKYELFENGKLLFDRLKQLGSGEVSIIVTDIEMPVMDGMTLLKHIVENNEFKNLPVLINTNMGNQAVIDTAYASGAKGVVKKLDFENLYKMIVKYALQ